MKSSIFLLSLVSCVFAGPANLEHGHEEEHFDAFPSHYDEDGYHDVEFDHTAFLGGIKIAEEYELLPKKEALVRLEAIIRKIDENKDGHVDKNELIVHLIDSLQKIDVEAAYFQFEETDEDKDDFVTWEEYFEANFNFGDQNRRDEEKYAKAVGHGKKLFKGCDGNKDGKISVHEYQALHTPHVNPEAEKIEVEYIMESLDLDHDNVLTFKEYVYQGDYDEDDQIDFNDPDEQEWLDDERIIFDEEIDINGDGVGKGYEELANLVRPQYYFEAREEANHLIELADMDTDDQLSYKEMLDKHEIFSGSYESHRKPHTEL